MRAQITVAILLVYVFFRDFRPNEPFLTQFILQDKNLTKIELYNKVYPTWSYCQAPFLIIVLLLTDVVKYRPVIWTGALGYVGTMLLLIFGHNVRDMVLMQVTYALGTACEIGYKNYIFVVLPKADYSRVTFYLSAAALLGKSLSNFLAQLLIDYGHLDYIYLSYISMVTTVVAMLTSLCIPSVTVASETAPLIQSEEEEKRIDNVKQWWEQVKISYASPHTRTWSYWLISVTAVYFMIANTTQSLWKDLQTKEQRLYNGYVYAMNFLLSAGVSYALARRSDDVKKVSWWMVMVLAMLLSALTFTPTILKNLYIAYLCDALFNIIVSSTICVCSFKIAEGLESSMYGFVGGFNTCIAAIVDMCVSFIVIDKKCLGLGPVAQYRVYGGWLVVVCVVYGMYTVCRLMKEGSQQGIRMNERKSNGAES